MIKLVVSRRGRGPPRSLYNYFWGFSNKRETPVRTELRLVSSSVGANHRLRREYETILPLSLKENTPVEFFKLGDEEDLAEHIRKVVRERRAGGTAAKADAKPPKVNS